MVTATDIPTLGELVREKRGKTSMVKEAARLGVSRQVYKEWEDNYTIPRYDWIAILADHLELQRDTVLRVVYHTWLISKGGVDDAPITQVTDHVVELPNWAFRPIPDLPLPVAA